MSPLQHVTVQLAPCGKTFFWQAAEKDNNLGALNITCSSQTRRKLIMKKQDHGTAIIPPSLLPPSGRFVYGRHGEVRGKIRIKSLNGINVTVDGLGFIWLSPESYCTRNPIEKNSTDFKRKGGLQAVYSNKETLIRQENNFRNKLRPLVFKIALGM